MIKGAVFDMDGLMFDSEKLVFENWKTMLTELGFEYNLEIMSTKAGKGNALSALADMLKIQRSKTISIGDSGNDITSIESAGLGLAVSNATDSLKAVADDIICSNEEHIVAYVLENFVKPK